MGFESTAENSSSLGSWPLLMVAIAGVVLLVGVAYVVRFLQRSRGAAVTPKKDSADSKDTHQTGPMPAGSTSQTFRAQDTLVALAGLNKAASISYRPTPYRPPWVVTDLPEDVENAVRRIDANHNVYTSYPPHRMLPTVFGHVQETIPLVSTTDAATGEVTVAPFAKGNVKFLLGGFRSEGPVGTEGESEAGWTFYFVDHREKIGCVATVTSREAALQYGHVTDVDVPARARGDREWDGTEQVPDIAAAIAAVRALCPELDGVPVHVWVAVPDTVLVYVRDPIVIADVAFSAEGVASVRNADGFRAQVATWLKDHGRSPRWSLEEVVGFYRGEAPSGVLAEFLTPQNQEGAREWSVPVMRSLGQGLTRTHGAKIVALLDRVIREALAPQVSLPEVEGLAEVVEDRLPSTLIAPNARDEDLMDLAKLAIHLMAFIPSGESMARLHTLAETLENDELAALAGEYFTLRRRRALGVRYDPIEALNFKERCERMGKAPVQVIPLSIEGYDIHQNLLAKLEEMGLTTQRLRVIAGSGEVVSGAYLRPMHGDTEVFVSVMPAPRQAIIAYVAGSAMATFAARISKSFEYTQAKMLADLSVPDPWETLVGHLGTPISEISDLLTRVNARRDTELASITDTGKFRRDTGGIVVEEEVVRVYTEEMLIQDLRLLGRSRIPAVHRAAVYLACLGESARVDPHVETLCRFYEAFPNQYQLQTAIIEALQYASSDAVSLFLQEKEQEERAKTARRPSQTLAILEEANARRRGEARPFIQPTITLPGIKERVTAEDLEPAQKSDSPAAS